MQILRHIPVVVLVALMSDTTAQAERLVSGTWALDSNNAEGDYVLASRGSEGQFLICFSSGNVRSIVVAKGDERSLLARGGCTVFAPSQEGAIIVGFASDGPDLPTGIALGTFVLIGPDSD